MTKTETAAVKEGERIAKVMARAGLCSRREAEVWIADGRVSVNGEILKSAARNVTAEDDVRVDGTVLRAAEKTRLWRYHKPPGLVTTHRDEKNRPTVFSTLPKNLPRVVSVGRLDLNSEGLLLLTNDGAVARDMELPSRAWERRYRVRVHGRVTQASLDRLKKGITVEGIHYGPIEATIDAPQGGATKANSWLIVTLTEGKNREIRKVLEALQLSVNRLIRIAYGPFQLGPLPPGEVEEVPRHILREQLGLAAEPGEKANTREGWAKAKPRPKLRHKSGKPGGKSGAKSTGRRTP
jgi:23S rRNA pseudouridine2605 synthase